MGTWVASMSWLLYLVLLWTLGCMYLFELVFSFFPYIYPGMEFLDHVVVLFLVFWGNSIPFSIVSAPVYILINSVQGFPFLHIFANICFFFNFFIFGWVGSSLLCMGFSSCGERVLLFVAVVGFSLWLLLLQSTGSRHAGFSSCSTQAQ